MSVIYVGKESYFHGKSLFQIARKYRNAGIGRMVMRKKWDRYEEPSYYRLTQVVPAMNVKGYHKGLAFGEKVFRGKNYGVCRIDSGYKFDWILVPKEQEQAIIDSVKSSYPTKETVVPYEVTVPPLMKMFISGELKAHGYRVSEDMFVTKRKIIKSKYSFAKLDKSAEDVPPAPEYKLMMKQVKRSIKKSDEKEIS
ncbi:uncharacterized protein LOC128225251 [Mya arenaria]|uniref:uncharacterized protein LOC128225251 n=1 Tax=Mya arenaria TaxID=6604 RepID=UPI0022E4D999|nr:uncharacterized protein LOC128225251 [Mya arenaria]